MRPFDSRKAPARLACAGAYADLFALWSRSAHREALPTYQLGYLRARRSRRRPPLPLLQLGVSPGGSIDFADPRSGFAGLGAAPAQERVLTLWADDLLSVRHGDDWIYVVDTDRPLPSAWLSMLTPPHRGPRPPYAVVTAAFAGPTPPGEFRVADLDATTHTTLAHIEDRRGEVSDGRVVRLLSDRASA
jgi:hypothetical protein